MSYTQSCHIPTIFPWSPHDIASFSVKSDPSRCCQICCTHCRMSIRRTGPRRNDGGLGPAGATTELGYLTTCERYTNQQSAAGPVVSDVEVSFCPMRIWDWHQDMVCIQLTLSAGNRFGANLDSLVTTAITGVWFQSHPNTSSIIK